MYKIYPFFICLFVFFGTNSFAQVTCGSDDYLQEQLRSNPEFQKRLDAFEKVWQEKQAMTKNTANRMVITGTDTVYEIPVVFHVIHPGVAIGTQFNPTSTKINAVMTYLNQVYGATYSSYAPIGNGGVNIPIRFVLARRDPNCNATDGINRIDANSVLTDTNLIKYVDSGVARQTTGGGISNATLKGIVQWDPSLYYNIWVVNKIDGWSGYVFGGGVVGYAQFAGGPLSTDGTVIMEAFNAAGQSTLPHELGHAFNLYHTFQGGCVDTATNPCLTTGDKVCDTEPQPVNYNCPTGYTTCGVSYSPTIKNIMSYSNCMDKRFTAGQRERAMTALFLQRGSLIMSLGGTAPGAQPTYSLPIALSGCSTPAITNSGNSSNMGPSFVQIADLQYYSQGYSGDGNQQYVNRTVSSCSLPAAAPAQMNIGQAYPVEIGTGNNRENVRIWIDFNNDGSFSSPSELVFSSDGVIGDQYRIHTGNTIVIPTTADTSVVLRMRVVSDFYGNNNPAACGSNLQYGQAEDFSVKISAAPSTTPIVLKNIYAKTSANNKSIDVTWEVATEINITHYEIESSLDGKSFFEIGSLIAKGNNSAYLFNDVHHSINKTNYYRLKIIGQDNEVNYSTIVSASINNIDKTRTDQLKIYPNPATELINIVAQHNGIFEVSITNELGQVVYIKSEFELKTGIPSAIDLTSSSLRSGVYFLQLKEKSGLSLTGRFVKE